MRPENPQEVMRRYPRVTAHRIAESLGYPIPSRAAQIGLDGLHGRANYCEWIYSCYGGNAREALRRSIRNRHYHTDHMPEYRIVKKLVYQAIETGGEPIFARWS